MARGGGGGGRGGGGSRGGRHHHSSGASYVPVTPLGRFLTKHEGILFGLLFFVVFIFHSVGEPLAANREQQLSDFASAQYELVFGQTECYEDNLLLLLVVHEDRSDFSYMTWVGDHIGDPTFEYLRGEGTWLDDLLTRQLREGYTYTLSGDLHRAIRDLADQIDSVTQYGSHTCTEDHSDSPTYVRNLSELELNEELVEDALAYFRQETRIPIVVVIAESSDVYGTGE